jgi:hypothetical protein
MPDAGECDAQFGNTALIRAAGNSNADCVRLLLDAGADKEARDNVSVDGGIFHVPVVNEVGHPQDLHFVSSVLYLILLSRPRFFSSVDVCARPDSQEERTALMKAIQSGPKADSLDCVRQLVDAGADFETKDKACTLLFFIVCMRVRMLLSFCQRVSIRFVDFRHSMYIIVFHSKDSIHCSSLRNSVARIMSSC